MTTNMYRVGDYVYFETSSTSPYQIRRIEELIKTPSGNVEAKVMCFYRRRDLPNPLVQLADKHQLATAGDSPIAMKLKKMWLKTPVSEEQAAQAIMDPSIAALDEDRSSPCISDKVGVTGGSAANNNLTNDKGEPLSSKQRNQMKHRELFLSRQQETLPATHIRGKCSVTMLNETESLLSYLNKDDTFFYCLVFDPTQKTLLADKGEIRVGSRYQTEVQAFLRDGERDSRTDAAGAVVPALESLVWTPHHALSDRKIDQFLVVSRSVGTFARALDCSSSVKQPSLHMSAAAASRDITLFHAMDTLHKHNYSIESAMCSLVPSSGPVLCRDEMEEWSASEANLFEEALEKYGKDFNDIRQDFLPWKSLKNIVEYYYMWKTTDRYVQQKRVKAVEAELKLKQVYIPNYPKPGSTPGIVGSTGSKGVMNGNNGGPIASNGSNNNNASSNNNDVITINGGKPCESCCETASPHWYAWGPTHLCQTCWTYWKKYGGLKVASSRLAADSELELLKKKTSSNDADDGAGAVLADLSSRPPHKCSIVNCGKDFKVKAHLARHYAQAHGIAIRSGSPRPIMKTRTAFYLHTTGATKLSRRLCRQIIRSKKAARQPSFAINIQAVKQEFATAMSGKLPASVAHLLHYKKKNRGSVTHIADRLGNPGPLVSEWLILTPKENMPKPDVVFFPKPPKAADGSLMYERIPNKLEPEKAPSSSVAPIAANSSASPTHSSIASTNAITSTTALGLIGTTATPVPLPLTTTASANVAVVPPMVSLVVPTVAAPTTPTSNSHLASNPLKRRTHDDSNGVDRPAVSGPPAKRPNKDPMPSHRPTPEQYAAMMAAAAAAGQPLPRHHMNGKPKIAQMTRTGSGRKQVISWTDAPDDVFFHVNEFSKKTRKALTVIELRRAARKPWRPLLVKSAATALHFPSVPASLGAVPPSLPLAPHGPLSSLISSVVPTSLSSHATPSVTSATAALSMHAVAAAASNNTSAYGSSTPLLHQQTHLLQQAIHNATPQAAPTVPVLPSTSSDLQVVILD